MRIKTKLRLVVSTSVVTAAILVSAIIIVSQRTYSISERGGQYQELALKMFALQALTDAYLLRPTERTIDQWESVHKSLGALLGESKPEHHFEAPLLVSLAMKHREIVLPFSRLVELQSDSQDVAFSMILKERISNQISVQLQMMMGDAFGLIQQSRKQILASERQINRVTVILVFLLVTVPGGLLLLTSNRIVQSVLHLHEATALIGSGDWDHKVTLEGDDEIGRLARAFNEMAGKLSITYAALQVEVADRKRVQGELRIHKERLEELVEERTRELVAANTQLKQQIEARLQIEKELRESEERFRLFMDNSPTIAWVKDENGRYIYLSKSYEQRFGVRLEDLRGKTDAELWPREVAEDFRRNDLAVLDAGHPIEVVEETIDPDGSHSYWLTSKFPFRDATGIRFVAGIGLDITERKQVEEALIQTRIDQDRAQEVGQIGSWRLDVRHNILTWSDENHRIFGVSQGTPLTYETFLGIIHPDDRRYVDTQWKAALSGEPYDIEHRIVVSGQVKWVREKAYLEFDDVHNLLGGFGITQDITERKRMEEELRENEERIRVSLAEKEVLLKEIHHRVKNNMQIISSLVSLQADQLQDEALRAVLQDVTHRVRSMAMVHEKLYQSADLARVEFAEYVRSLSNYLFRAYGTGASDIRLALELEPVSLSVDAAVPCGLILNELVSNALKHAFRGRAGGEVAVSLHGDGQGRLRLCVRDDGTGLPAGFDWRHAQSLGLRLVEMLAGQLHAQVEVSSGAGTGFTITLKRE